VVVLADYYHSHQTFFYMKTRTFNAFCFLLCCTLFFACRKDSLNTFSNDTIYGMELTTPIDLNDGGVEDRNRGTENSPCFALDSNAVSITFRLKNGNLATPICFSESDLVPILIKANMSGDAARAFLKEVFYTIGSTCPQKSNQLGNHIIKGYNLPADYNTKCFIVSILGRKDCTLNDPGLNPKYAVPAPLITQSGVKNYAYIDHYTLRQARASDNGCALIREGGFSGVRFRNKVTRESRTVNIPSLDSLYRIFIQAGISEAEITTTMTSVMRGEMSMRAVWELYQNRLVPALPTAKSLKKLSNLAEWRLEQVGIGLFDSNGTIESFYYAKGDGPVL
jgi:hypothetical protein